MFFTKVPSIKTIELEQLLGSKPKIIDVREPYEYKEGHIPNAINVPLGKISTYQPTEKVYLICHSGARSQAASKQLQKQGFDVVNVTGGMMSWRGKRVK